jgi:chromosome segregation ATPase
MTSTISYKTQIRTFHLILRFYRPILPSSKSFLTVDLVGRQQSLTAITPLINIILASTKNFVPAFHPYLFALNNAIAQLKVIHNQLRVAEDHIATIAARDDALVARMQEAETVVQQARATMGRNETENRILKASLKDAEGKVQRAEQRASAAEESLANVDRLLQSPVGQENKWCYQQLDALQPDLASEEAHLQAPQTVLSTSPSVNSKSPQASLRLRDETARSEAEARIVDLMEQASAAEARALDLQVELSRHNRVIDDYRTLLRDAEERSTRMDAQIRECQEALTAAVLRGDEEASERRAAQLTLESICAERGSPFVVPPLLDALRLIVRHSAHTKR